MSEWETIYSSDRGRDRLQRCPVPGGWLYRCTVEPRQVMTNLDLVSMSIAFVPNPSPKDSPNG